MWLAAIDMALSRLANLSAPPPTSSGGKASPTKLGWGRAVLARVRAVSVSGQQHGTVFWKTGAEERLKGLGDLGPRATLVEVGAGASVTSPLLFLWPLLSANVYSEARVWPSLFEVLLLVGFFPMAWFVWFVRSALVIVFCAFCSLVGGSADLGYLFGGVG